MCCIAIMPMEKRMRIFKGAVTGCLKSKFSRSLLVNLSQYLVVRVYQTMNSDWNALVNDGFAQ